MAILFILTGGTIDSHYDGTKDTAVPNRKSIIPDYLRSLDLHEKIIFKTVCMKDSRDLTGRDRDAIVRAIEASPGEEIIITHGTYTMAETAKHIRKKLKAKNKRVVLTGSFLPVDGFTISDGPFNIGYAVAKIGELRPGVYACMNGKVFEAGRIIKDRKRGRFSASRKK